MFLQNTIFLSVKCHSCSCNKISSGCKHRQSKILLLPVAIVSVGSLATASTIVDNPSDTASGPEPLYPSTVATTVNEQQANQDTIQ